MAKSKQASKHAHARVQCSPGSVGLAQARPNNCCSHRKYYADMNFLISSISTQALVVNPWSITIKTTMPYYQQYWLATILIFFLCGFDVRGLSYGCTEYQWPLWWWGVVIVIAITVCVLCVFVWLHQVTEKIEVSYKLSVSLSHWRVALILEYMYTLSQSWRE